MKVLRFALLVLIGLLCSFPMWLPLFFGLTWVSGWPDFLSRALAVILIAPIIFFLRWLSSKKETPDKQKDTPAKVASNVAIFVAIYIVLQAFFCFWMPRERIVEHLHSPNNKNTAVIEMWNDEEPYEHGRIYVGRARYLKEDRSDIFWTSKHDERAFTWIDDNTLEVAYVHKYSGQIIKEYLHW